MSGSVLVVPCYDEAGRLPADELLRFRAEHPDVRFVLVDDGSTDATLERLEDLARKDPEGFSVLGLQPNRGKGEAVRRGVLEALESNPRHVGYWDADLSTPLEEVPRFVHVLERQPEIELVLGARVKLLGRSIERRAARHYVGRIFATLISQVLELPVYDTQCGAKLMRASPDLRSRFERPFSPRWLFDVEIVERLLRARRSAGAERPQEALYELPLRRWRHAPGSKLGLRDGLLALRDLARIRQRIRARG